LLRCTHICGKTRNGRFTVLRQRRCGSGACGEAEGESLREGKNLEAVVIEMLAEAQ